MRQVRLLFILASCALAIARFEPAASARGPALPAYQRFLSPASPLELVAAKKADRVAWVAFEEGKRNAYTAAAPAFAPVRLTSFLKDDGIDMSGDPDLGRRARRWRSCAARRPNRRRLGGERVGRPRRTRARRLGGADRWRARVPRVRSCRAAATPWRRTAAPSLFVKDGQIYRARGHAGAAGDGDGPRREAVHHGVGRPERAGVVARRQEDRVRQHAHRPQLHRRLRHGDANGDVHGAERRLRLEPDVDGRRQEPRVRAAAGLLPFGQQAQQAARNAGTPGGPAASRRDGGRGAAGRGTGAPAPQAPTAAGHRTDPRPDARDVQGRLHLLDLEGGRRHRRGEGSLAQPAGRSDVRRRRGNLWLAGDHLVFRFNVGGGRRRRAWAQAAPAGAARRPGGRVGSVSTR